MELLAADSDLLSELLPSLSLDEILLAPVEERISITSPNLPADVFFNSLVVDTDYGVVISEDVDVRINLSLPNVTIEEAMDIVAEIYKLDITRRGNIFTVREGGLRTRQFTIDYLNVQRQGSSTISVSAQGGQNGGGFVGGGFGGGGFGGGGFGGSTSRAWDGIWEVRTAMRPDGWSAEIRIPFRTLNFDPNRSEWGINFQRTIRRKNEEILWRGYRRSEGLRSPVYAGRLTGLQDISQGVGLEARPSMVANWRNVPADPVRNTYPTDVSLDVNYSVTSSLRASVSVNTDFAELESDQRRVNLTRFPLRFPERRDFFLEGSGVFSFAPRSGPSPFYSRNIGISDGQQVPIRYGTRLTGQVDAFEVGFYQIGTGEHTYLDSDNIGVTTPSEEFTVARVKHRLFEQSAIGAIYTRREGMLDGGGLDLGAQHTAGVDLDFSTRHFLGDKNL
ncbi:MAG: hypothetical protein IIC10_05625, partial [Proteobacteria bacterium]|nr:hypothetical protein [Pseudomonadota bacterium]